MAFWTFDGLLVLISSSAIRETASAYIAAALLKLYLFGFSIWHGSDELFAVNPQEHEVAVGAADSVFEIFRFRRFLCHPILEFLFFLLIAGKFQTFSLGVLTVGDDILDVNRA